MTDDPDRAQPWWETEGASGPQGFHVRRRTVFSIAAGLIVFLVFFITIAALNTAGIW